MKIPEIPNNEAERLAALRSYDILDSDVEASFDALPRLAAAILEVPVALITVLDEHRQWFKSRYGLDLAETPRDVSFCAHVVAQGAGLVVRDAREDPRFSGNPFVAPENGVRFYAGMPLQTPAGFVLGTLCAVDYQPKKPTPRQLEMLALLAGQVVDQLEARRERLQLAGERAVALETAARLKVLFDGVAEGVVLQDADGRITAANASAERILGLSVDQMTGRTSVDTRWRTVREDGSPFPAVDLPAMITLRTGAPTIDVTVGVHKPNGNLMWLCVNSLPLRHTPEGNVHSVVTTFRDVTELKRVEAEAARLSRQEHLVTIGTLAAGVGHEINNPLSYILSNIELALDELRAMATTSTSRRELELIEMLTEAHEGAERVRKIVLGLRALSREGSAVVPTDIQQAVAISLNMTAHETRHKATVHTHLAPVPLVLADESRLSQVLINLLVNAAEAFVERDPGNNRITITTALETDGRVSITVADNGPGIPIELQRRIFDPFFTTKPVGQGTGLGLSISQTIITALAGEMVLESAVGGGTEFRILLPAAPSSLSVATPTAPHSPAARGRIMVIDDEPMVLRSIERSLEKQHEVLAVGDSREALQRIRGGEHLDVIVCDMTMPHLGGKALYERVLASDPPMAKRFVFVTGGATDGVTEAFLADVPNAKIRKPIDVGELRRVIAGLVASRGVEP